MHECGEGSRPLLRIREMAAANGIENVMEMEMSEVLAVLLSLHH